ncbi:MAG: hypothetical protein IJ727_00810 [Treponema sp.]|nr:hypothetical protein [Treponema sp.]
MFDKLGDLLSAALEAGELPKSHTKEENPAEASPASLSKEEAATPKTKKAIIPPRILTALAFFSISPETDYSTARKIYRDKLKYYHPDRRNDNPTLQKVAKEKTARLLEEWEILEEWYTKRQTNL